MVGKINPDRAGYDRDCAECLLMLHNALTLLPKTFTQTPRWEQQPTPEMLRAEQNYLDEAEEASRKVEALAGHIYFALTGKKVIQVQDHYPVKEVEWVSRPKPVGSRP